MILWVWVQVGEGHLIVPTRIGFFLHLGFGDWASALWGQLPKSGLRGEGCLPNVFPLCRFCVFFFREASKDTPPLRGHLLNLGTNERGGIPPGLWDPPVARGVGSLPNGLTVVVSGTGRLRSLRPAGEGLRGGHGLPTQVHLPPAA